MKDSWICRKRAIFICAQEPVAFFGGFAAGLLRLDLKADPLRDWLQRTATAAGDLRDGAGR